MKIFARAKLLIKLLLPVVLLYLVSVFRPQVFGATGIYEAVNFQGKMVNSNGTNVSDGDYDFEFKLHTLGVGGSVLWTATYNGGGCGQLPVSDGVFEVKLGSCQALPPDFNQDSIYLSVNFTSDGEMEPRIRFTAVPYAINAKKVAGLTVTNTTGTLTIPDGKTIQFADDFTTQGAFGLTLSTTATTNATFPEGSITIVDTASSQTLTNKTIGSTGLTFSGADTDITTAAGEHFVIVPNGGGKVAIGTTTPLAKLHIEEGAIYIGDTSAPTPNTNKLYANSGDLYWAGVQLGQGGSWQLNADSGTVQTVGAGNTAVFSGGVGIGTTVSASDTVTLNVDESYGFSWTGTHGYAASDINFTNGTSLTLDVTGDLFFDADGGDIVYGDNSTWWGGWNTGNFGVGTTNPQYLLDVNGNVSIGGTATIGTIPTGSDNNTVLMSNSGVVESVNTTDWDKDTSDDYGDWAMNADSGTVQSIGNGQTAVFSGGVGIGTTVDATDTLTINVDESTGFSWTGTHGYAATDLDFTNSTSFTLDTSGDLFLDADGGGLIFGDAGSWFGGWEGGNFGIGTTNPDARFGITFTSAPTIDMAEITNVGYGTVTNGVDGIFINFVQAAGGSGETNASINIGMTGSGDAADTLAGLSISTNGVGAGNLYGVQIGNITGGGGTEYAVIIGTGWDRGLSVDSPAQISSTLTVTGNIVIGSTGNTFTFDPGSGPTYAGNARPTKTVILAPEFPGASITADGGTNTGTMTSDFCSYDNTNPPDINTGVCTTSGDIHNYYTWTTTEASAQDYDVWIRYRMPNDFAAFLDDDTIKGYGWRTDVTNNAINLSLFDDADAQCGSTTNLGVGTTSWDQTNLGGGGETSCSGISAGDIVTFRIQLVADQNDSVRAGEITFSYYASF